ncbi:MAG: peptidylprolyl isomerase [Bacteroidaceae bacterium]|nr:peptidylprolyl isomerase [Bacteroidaceae bacterium]
MKRFIIGLPLVLAFLFATGCGNSQKSTSVPEEDIDTVIVDSDQYVRFETTAGNFVIKLYRGTPLHRHNMVKQVKKGVYDGQLFFGIERGYKIQAGDPKSKGARPGVALGVEEENDTIQSEINPFKYYHKKGAVGQASLRQFDFSTSQQFYIITGIKSNDATLDACEKKINKRYFKAVKDSLTQPYAKDILEYRDKGYKNKISVLNDKLNKETEAIMKTRPEFKYSKAQRKQYATEGGAANLDGFYTVFGEVIEGIEVIEKISMMHVDINSRPDPDVKIIKATLIDCPE